MKAKARDRYGLFDLKAGAFIAPTQINEARRASQASNARVRLMSHIELLRKWVEAFNAGHVETMAMLYADHAVNFQTKNLLSVGKSAIIRGFVEEFSSPRISRSVDNIHEDGEWMILEWKDALGYRGCQIFQMAGGSIVLQRGY